MEIHPERGLTVGDSDSVTGDVSDEALIADATAYRDQSAFGELVRRHQGRVRGYLRKIARNPSLADDLAQETFIRAWDKLTTFQGRGNFAAWLVKIAHNQFLQSLRKSDRDRRLNERLESETGGDELPSTRGAQPDESISDLPRLLAVLSEEERAVMVLNYAYGFSHAEITDVTGLALGTVKSHIHRGKAKIRERFAPAEAHHG